MTKLRISIVQYLNTAPLVWGFTNGPQRGKYELSFTVPSQCAEALRAGVADVAIIPAIEYARIDDLVVLPDLAIAAQRQVRSLLLIAKKPIEEARRIALDRSSRSTQALVRILCADQWKFAPEFFEADPELEHMLGDADAALLIGDPALRLSVEVEGVARRGPSGELICDGGTVGMPGLAPVYIYDVVEQWRRATGLPAVLAIWAAPRQVVTPQLVQDFLASRAYGLTRIGEISAAAAKELGLPVAALERYLRENIDFSLSPENQSGLEHFYARAATLGLIAEAKVIEWAPLWENARAKA